MKQWNLQIQGSLETGNWPQNTKSRKDLCRSTASPGAGIFTVDAQGPSLLQLLWYPAAWLWARGQFQPGTGCPCCSISPGGAEAGWLHPRYLLKKPRCRFCEPCELSSWLSLFYYLKDREQIRENELQIMTNSTSRPNICSHNHVETLKTCEWFQCCL